MSQSLSILGGEGRDGVGSGKIFTRAILKFRGRGDLQRCSFKNGFDSLKKRRNK